MTWTCRKLNVSWYASRYEIRRPAHLPRPLHFDLTVRNRLLASLALLLVERDGDENCCPE